MLTADKLATILILPQFFERYMKYIVTIKHVKGYLTYVYKSKHNFEISKFPI